MLRKFFVDCVAVFALCLVVWGSAPVWAACICTETLCMKRLLLFSFILFFGVTVRVTAGEIVIDFAHPQFARLDSEGKRLLSEYAKIYPKIKDFYENMRIDVTVKRTDNPSEKSLQSLRSKWESEGLSKVEIQERIERDRQSETQYEVRYRFSDKYGRVDKKVNHPITDSIRAKLPPVLAQKDFIHESEIALFTPAMDYQLSKNDPQKQYFSLNAKRDVRKPNSEGISIEVMYFDRAPLTSNNTLLDEILFQSPPLVAGIPYRVVEYVRQKDVGGEQIVEIRLVSSMHLDSNPYNIHGEIRLHRDSWAVKETYTKTLGMSSGNIGWIRASCTYDGEIDGVPLLKTYQRSEGTYDKESQEEKMTREMYCEVTNLIPGPPDLSEFDVAQFLPPGVKIGKDILPAHFSPIRIAAIVVGLILFILGIYMRLRRART